jgi:hypothetical protein
MRSYCYSSRGEEYKMGGQDCGLSGTSKRKSIALSFSASKDHLYSLAYGAILHLQSRQCCVFRFLSLSLSL